MSFTVARIRPKPGQELADVTLDPGLYEIDMRVPGWVVPDYDTEKEFSVNAGNQRLTHIRSHSEGDVLTVRFQIDETHDTGNGANPVQQANVFAWLQLIARWVLAPALVALIINQIRGLIIEIRKLIKDAPAAALAGGVGLGLAVVVGAVVLLGHKGG